MKTLVRGLFVLAVAAAFDGPSRGTEATYGGVAGS